MKHLMELTEDFIIETKFYPNYKTEEGKPTCDWVDDTKSRAKGKNLVQAVYFHMQEFGHDGYSTPFSKKVTLNKEDILKLADAIRQGESQEAIGVPGDDLPF